ncbi:MAG: CHAT domain-containing protein [Mycobacterium sp.]
MAVDPSTLVLRYADVGVATYGTLRVVGEPGKTVTWVVSQPILLAALETLTDAVPDPTIGEAPLDAVERAVSKGPFSSPNTELMAAYKLGVLLISTDGWRLLVQCVSDPRATLFVAPSAKLAGVPWGLLALPTTGPTQEELVRAQAAAAKRTGFVAARIPWQLGDMAACTDGYRLIELVDVLWAVPPNIARAPRTPAAWSDREQRPAVLILDPRVPGQRPDSSLGSVLGRPSPETSLSRHYAGVLEARAVLPRVDSAVELFRRADADRVLLAEMLAAEPSRMLYVGHASAADGDLGYADRAALHLACSAALPGDAEPVGDHRPLTASDVVSQRLPLPPRVALLACASGGDYRFDEATGLVGAMVLGGAQLVTATLWSLPTTAGYRRFAPPDNVATQPACDPMSDVVVAVDRAHEESDAALAVNRWQRRQMRRWRDGDVTASPLYWAALATFTVDGMR